MAYSAKIRLTGMTPLLMHADNIEECDRLTAWRKDSANKRNSTPGDDRSPAWTWQTYLYHDGTHLAMPAENFAACVRTAAAKISMKGQKSYKEISQSGMFVSKPSPQFLAFYSNGKQIKLADILKIDAPDFTDHWAATRKLGFDLLAKRAKVGQAKHIRVRPLFNEWTVEGEIDIIDEAITKRVLGEILQLAGQAGLGDWRPGCKTPGSFGMFRAEIL